MALTLAQKSAIRRHLKYGVVGNYVVSPGGAQFAQGSVGYRFFQAYGALEYRMNNMNPDEEARIVGAPYGAVSLVGPTPNQGDTASITLSGGSIASPQTVTATVGPPTSGNVPALTVALTLASLINQNAVLQAAKIYALAPYGTGPWAANAVPVPELGFRGPAGSAAFTVAVSGSGLLYPSITADGSLLPPGPTSLDGGNTVLWGYIPILDALEAAYWTTSDNLDTSKTVEWSPRSNEAGQRRSLYENTVALLSDFLGIPVNKDATQKPKRSGGVAFA
jgi:hypothetical protein